MFDSSEKPSLDQDSRSSVPRFNWEALSIPDIIELYDQIRQHLPPVALKDMDIEEEMLLQFHTLRALQTELLNDDEQPLNQRVALANAVTSNLGKLGDLQQSIYTSERFKLIETLLIRMLSAMPADVSAQFLADYEALLTKKRAKPVENAAN